MAAMGKAPPVKRLRAIDQLELELVKRTAERDEALAREAVVTAERNEALAREAAIAEVLQVINSSPEDLAPVFDAMIEKAMTLCEASCATLYTLEADRARLAAIRGASDLP